MSNSVFELKDIRFSYLGKYEALCGVDMSVRKGQRIAIIGQNGCGKSTLLNILGGLTFPDSGFVEAFGKKLDESALSDERFNKYFRTRVGLVFQNPDVQLFCPTVKEEIMFAPLNFGFSMREMFKVFDTITEIFGIRQIVDRMPHQLSVGEKRKVAVASVLIYGPDVLLLDEPTAGLDPKTSRSLIDLLNRYHKDGKTIITATHDMHIIEEIADVVYVFGPDKRIARIAPPDELLADTKFLEENNLIHVHAHRHKGELHAHPHRHPSHVHPHT